MLRKIIQLVAVSGLLLVTNACGGAGTTGGGGTTPPPPGSTPPPPPPPPENFDTAEYRLNTGLAHIKAIAAYDDGVSGEGIIIGIVDTGIDTDNTELMANIHAASKDVVVSRSVLEDQVGHGTQVAGIIGAVKNGANTHGVAFDSKLLALRADFPGDCDVDSCSLADSDIAAAIDFAVARGAGVINLSIGGDAPASSLETAVANAVAAGVIIVIAAGNEESTISPNDFALMAIDTFASDQIIVVGSVGATNTISTFSNYAGPAQDVYVVAPGEGVQTTTIDGGQVLATGTSYSAPLVTGAVALLLEKFPSLTPVEVVDIILRTATDLGTPGTDGTYGRGLVDISAAFTPLGTVSVSVRHLNSFSQLDLAQATIIAGPAFGDAFMRASALSGFIGFDEYNRAFEFDGRSQIRSNVRSHVLDQFLGGQGDWDNGTLTYGNGGQFFFSAKRPDFHRDEMSGLHPIVQETGDSFEQTQFLVQQRLNSKTMVGFGQGIGLDQMFEGERRRDPRDPFRKVFYGSGANVMPFLKASRGSVSVGFSHSLTPSVGLEGGFVQRYETPDRITQFQTDQDEVRSQTVIGGIRFGSGAQMLRVRVGYQKEEGSVLGSYSSGVLALGRVSETQFVSVSASHPLFNSLSLYGEATGGLMQLEAPSDSFFASVGRIGLSHFRAGLMMSDLPFVPGRLSWSVSQPLRVESGTARVDLPVAWDYGSQVLSFEERTLGLAPSGREIDLEAALDIADIEGWNIRTNVLFRMNPGHSRSAPNETAVTFEAGTRF